MFVALVAKSVLVGEGSHTLRAMLSERDRRVLDFESNWWAYPGPKDVAVRHYLGMSATRYYQVLRRLMDDDDALAIHPLTVRRLQRVRRDAAERRLQRLDGAGT